MGIHYLEAGRHGSTWEPPIGRSRPRGGPHVSEWDCHEGDMALRRPSFQATVAGRVLSACFRLFFLFLSTLTRIIVLGCISFEISFHKAGSCGTFSDPVLCSENLQTRSHPGGRCICPSNPARSALFHWLHTGELLLGLHANVFLT